MNPPGLLLVREAIRVEPRDTSPWMPHLTILQDDSETICKALPVLLESFHPFLAKISRLHLCAFWPAGEILSVTLREA